MDRSASDRNIEGSLRCVCCKVPILGAVNPVLSIVVVTFAGLQVKSGQVQSSPVSPRESHLTSRSTLGASNDPLTRYTIYCT